MARKPGLALSLLAVIGLAATWTALEGGVNTWTCIGPPGGMVSELAVDPLHSNVVFALSDQGILHRTTDSGAHWTAVPFDFDGTRSIAIHPQNPSIVLVGAHVVYRSADGGGSWAAMGGHTYLSVVDIAFAPSNPNVVYAATDNQGVRKSTDAGITWTACNSGLPSGVSVRRVAVAGGGDVVYSAVSGRGVYATTNGGSSWTARVSGITNGATSTISALAVDPANDQTAYAAVHLGALYKTTNGGGQWADPAAGEAPTAVEDLKLAPGSSQTIYAAALWGSSGAVAKSTNGGVNWTPLQDGFGGNEIISVGIDPQNPQILYAGGKWTGAFRSSDGGQHWSPTSTGLNNHTVRALVQDPSDSRVLYVAAEGDGIYRTSNGGTSWEKASTGLPEKLITALAWAPGAPASLFAGTTDRGVYRSTDRGTTWVPSRTGIETQGINCLVLDPTSDVGTLYAGTKNGGVFRTIDSGGHWTSASTGLPGGEIADVVPDPHQAGRVFAVTDYAGIYRSTNRGDNWAKLPGSQPEGPQQRLVVDAIKKDWLYSRANDQIFRSTNAGDSWVSVSTGLSDSTGSGLAADPSRSGTLYTSEYFGEFRSVDGGDQWTEFDNGLFEPLGAIRLYANGAASPTVYAGTTSKSVWAITLDYSNAFYFPQVGDGASDTISLKTSLILVNTGERSDVRVEFFDSTADPMALSLGSAGTGAVFAIGLERGEAVALQTPGTGGLKAGYARISTGSSVGGTAVFTYSDQGVIQYESGVPGVKPLKDFSLFMDSTPNRETGLAFVNTSQAIASMTMRLFDTSFQLVSTRLASPFLAGRHLAKYAPEIFPEVTSLGVEQGVITVHADQPLAAVTLRQHNDPTVSFPLDIVTMSTFPVIPGRADSPVGATTNAVLYFPQVADGQQGTTRFRTTLVLVNTRAAASSAQIEFFQSDGSRMSVQLGGLGTNHTFGVPLAAGQAVALQTAGTGGLQAGYARVTTDSAVGGTVVFTLEQDGITLYDAGIPVSSPETNMTLFMDASGGRYDTGFALVNTGAAAARVTLRLYDTSFNLIQTVDLKSVTGGSDLGPGQHVARYATEVFPLIKSQNLQQGVITISSSQPLAAITLRQQDKPGVGLPGDVYLVTAFPVISGRAQ